MSITRRPSLLAHQHTPSRSPPLLPLPSQALAGIREDDVAFNASSSSSGQQQQQREAAARQGETAAVMSLVRLTSLLEKLPVLSGGSTEVALIAESLQVSSRKRAKEGGEGGRQGRGGGRESPGTKQPPDRAQL